MHAPFCRINGYAAWGFVLPALVYAIVSRETCCVLCGERARLLEQKKAERFAPGLSYSQQATFRCLVPPTPSYSAPLLGRGVLYPSEVTH